MNNVWIVLIGTAILSYLAIPLFRKIALRFGYVDRPNARKTQKEPLPMLGGLGMIAVFALAGTAIMLMSGAAKGPIWGIFFGVALLAAVGLIDDYAKTRGKDFPAFPKFLGQIAASYALIFSGIMIKGVNIPFGDVQHIEFSPWLAQLITVLWVVGVINAFNFLDGVDGLAGGVAAIAAATLMFTAMIMGLPTSALLAAALVGTTIGYLRHNFFPAKIIMGDTGSMFLGYVLGAVSVLGAFKSVTLFSILIPVLALGLPIFDAVYVIARRMLAKQPFYKPDRTHAHHRLMSVGLSQKQAVGILYLVGICFGLVSIILTLLEKYNAL